jgi:hypothetical protein
MVFKLDIQVKGLSVLLLVIKLDKEHKHLVVFLSVITQVSVAVVLEL